MSTPGTFKFLCPSCGASIRGPAASVGKMVACPGCKARFAAPKDAAPSRTLVMPAVEEATFEVADESLPAQPARWRWRSTRRELWMVAGAFAVALMVLVIGAALKSVGVNVGEQNATPSGPGQAAQTVQKEWLDVGEPQTFGDVRVTVTEATFGPVMLKDYRSQFTSTEPYLQMAVLIENLSETRIVTYASWRESNPVGGVVRVACLDNFNNVYFQQMKGSIYKPARGVIFERIYPGKSVSDLLAFDRPVAGIEHVRLSLDAVVFGGSGWLKCKIPAAKIEGLH